MTSRLFLYREDGIAFKLYVGNLSASEGLAVFPSDASISVEEYGATDGKGDGWITRADIPALSTVGELRKFLENDECHFIDLLIKVGDSSSFSSYEDTECNYEFQSQTEVSKVVEELSLAESGRPLASALLASPGVYIEYVGNGEVCRYESFDAYLSARRI